MSKRWETRRKGLSDSSSTPALTGLFRKPPFAEPVESDEVPHQPESMPDLQTQFDQEERFGYNFGRVKVESNIPELIHPKLAIAKSGDKSQQEADRFAAKALNISQPATQLSGETQPVQGQEQADEDQLMKKPEATSLTPLIQAGKAGDTIQCFKLSTDHQTNYPKFKRFVQNEMPKTANDTRITANLNTYGTNTGATARNISNDVAWGSGPTLNVTPLTGANGEFSPGIGSQEQRINQTIVSAYENERNNSRIQAHELFLESTILHEYTHYLDDQDRTDRAGEEGQDFEEATYGMDIDSVADAQNVLNASFGSGEWTVRVEEKEAGYQQRFIVSGAASGNGTYQGTVGTSATVRGRATGQWNILIEHNDGQHGWQVSQVLKVREGTNNFLIRSEDWTDRDRNDLVLRVRK